MKKFGDILYKKSKSPKSIKWLFIKKYELYSQVNGNGNAVLIRNKKRNSDNKFRLVKINLYNAYAKIITKRCICLKYLSLII